MSMRKMACLVQLPIVALVLLVLSSPCICQRAPLLVEDSVHPGVQLIHSDKGAAPILAIRKSHENSTALHLLQRHHGRELIGADAYMKLHDDLLNQGYYTTELHIGTPAQKFELIVDTGSTVTYVPCSTCKHCGAHQDTNFDPSHSNSYKPVPCGYDCQQKYYGQGCEANNQCQYMRAYAEKSSSSGVLGFDLIGFGDESKLQPQQLVFGCENDEEGDLFRQRADGIMGLGRGPLSVVDQLVAQGAIDNTFSLCYGGMDEVGGAMVLGSMTPPPGMVFATSDPDRSSYYNLPLEGIQVGGKLLTLSPSIFNAKHGTVIDSGTTYCYLPGVAFDAFVRAVKQQVGSSLKVVPGPEPDDFPDICFADAGSDPANLKDYFPTVDLVFGGNSVLSLAPENYLFRHVRIKGGYCLGVFKNDRDPTTLLGGIVVRNMLVTYDRGNKRIGFWRTKCTDLANQLSALSAPPPEKGVSSVAPPPVISSAGAQPPQLGSPPQVDAASPPKQLGPSPDGFGQASGPDFSLVIASLEMDISFTMSSSKFALLQSAFVEDMARELQLYASQVDVLSTSEKANHITVHWAVVPPPSSSNVSVSLAEGIVSRLVSHSVQLRDAFGSYQLTSWKLQPLSNGNRSWAPGAFKAIWIAILITLLIVAVAILVIAGVYRRIKGRHTANYMSIDQVDEKGELQPL